MPTLTDLARSLTDLRAADVDWLHLLLSDWQLLADLSFADLLLWLPTRDGVGYVCAAQMRPTTGATVYYDDLVGETVARGRRPQLDTAMDEGRICRERDPDWRDDIPVREETVPVVRSGRVVGVVSRHTNLASARTPSRLELNYLQIGNDLAQMVAEGRFPFRDALLGSRRGAPRVGDGLIRLDGDGVVLYASPNGVSAYRRLGVTKDLVGSHLGEVTAALAPSNEPVDEGLSLVVSGRMPRRTDVEANGTVVALRTLPLNPGGTRIGALVLARDVTEIRRRERELVTKDATIREIHHRVKNNLQTVAALLRLQARRLDSVEARTALEESVRRVGSIALVHETLSSSGGLGQAPGDMVDFDEVADRLVAMVVDVGSERGEVTRRRVGAFGTIAGEVATPLALVIGELVQNAVEHGLAGRGGTVELRATVDGPRLVVEVLDDGVGLPPGFDLVDGANLGLQIVRTLVVGELEGTIELSGRDGTGTRAVVTVPDAAAQRLRSDDDVGDEPYRR